VVPAVEQVEEGVRRSRLVLALLDLAQADVIDDQENWPAPPLEAALVGAVGEPGVEVVEEVGAPGVADGEFLLTGLEDEGRTSR